MGTAARQSSAQGRPAAPWRAHQHIKAPAPFEAQQWQPFQDTPGLGSPARQSPRRLLLPCCCQAARAQAASAEPFPEKKRPPRTGAAPRATEEVKLAVCSHVGTRGLQFVFLKVIQQTLLQAFKGFKHSSLEAAQKYMAHFPRLLYSPCIFLVL